MKRIGWVGSARDELLSLPKRVVSNVGYALYLAQIGDLHASAKPLKGFAGAGVVEIVADFDGDAYRAVYTVRFAEFVYVLHAFQKKSKTGRKTPAGHIGTVKRRLLLAQQDHETWTKSRQ